MPRKQTYAVVGGDMRQAYLADALATHCDDCPIYAMCLDKDVTLCGNVKCGGDLAAVLPRCDVVILPLPLLDSAGALNTPLSFGTLALDECLQHISPQAMVFGGKITPQARQAAHARGIELIDYLEREELTVLNAVPTAEGAVEIALRELPITLLGANCVVAGYGRIGKILARLLRAFGANVTVVARSCEALAWACADGMHAAHLPLIDDTLAQSDVIFNTVPSLIFCERQLTLLRTRCLVIDLASQPGGVDFDAAKKLGVRTIWALSRPGKVAPESAGQVILDTIFNILHERGGLMCPAQP